MDYSQIYKSYYTRYYDKFEEKIKHIFINNKDRHTSFGLVLNNLLKCLDNEIPVRAVINGNENLKKFQKIFNNRYSYYDEDLDQEIMIEQILKNQIKPEFEILTDTSLTDRYSFNDLIREIAFLNVCHEIRRLLQNHNRLFEMFYKTKLFDEFEIRDYRGIGLEQSEIFIKLNKILYPDYYLNSHLNINIEEVKTETESQEIDNITKTTKGTSNKLKTDEKSFLFYIMCKAISEEKDKKDNKKDEFNLPYTELLRLISLIDFFDEKVFSEKYRDSNHYQILSQGLNHFKKEDRLLFLQNLIKNIAEYKLTKTTKYIKQIANKTASLAVLSKK